MFFFCVANLAASVFIFVECLIISPKLDIAHITTIVITNVMAGVWQALGRFIVPHGFNNHDRYMKLI